MCSLLNLFFFSLDMKALLLVVIRNRILYFSQQYGKSYTCIVIIIFFMLIHTKTVVVFKQNVYSVYIYYFTKIHFPPNCFVGRCSSYLFCPHTGRYISINCVSSAVADTCIGVWLCGNFVEGYVIFRWNKTLNYFSK